ncbi:MAG: DNA polymerase/3'-5' exonuclease PolX [Candidatus Marinimicrobia bacterium]|nr:DNA polymerase/3'-5' exonuclease PolX [Candidatus Neomarinimicrobiota bacterium]MCF7828415.1 DNA polymerase/3'-5' exonuclease PolX [Candidatus Neomarinimicrobiota bacterium]MCF7880991.1 DNA polymerase/3'-5' exonuclease PolX [Candidatus Neomarinimicrobiota bacterium]
MTKKDVAKVLNEIGTMMELQGENPFKARAYYNGARTIETLTEDITDLVENGEIGDVKGIGEALSQKITELVQTGKLEYYEKLKSEIPEGLFKILEIPGLGPKKVKKIWNELEITKVGELEYACQENRLVDLEGFGAKTQEKILDGIKFIKKYQERWLIDEVMEAAEPLIKFVKGHDKVIRAELAGSLRRHRETVKDADIVASCAERDRKQIMREFTELESVDTIIGSGETKTSVRLESGINADLRLVSDEQFPYALHHFTGSKEHNTAMRSLAKSMDMKMNEYGLFRNEDELVECADESEIFEALGLSSIPPELRENTGEIEFAKENEFPALVAEDDIRGMIHVHTHYSDGVPSVKEWVEACIDQGYEYLGITDHSQTAFYANGLKPERLKKQWEEIAKVQEEFPGFTIFRGIESDILPDGSLDYEDDILEQFDFVIASVHSTFNLTREKQTERLIKAVENKYTTILGHPTGRLLLARDEYDVDLPAVIEAAGEAGTAIEINANPRRLDLDWRLGKLAREHGIKTSINPDAHSIDGMSHVRYGVGIARKGWFTKEDVINAWDVEQVREFFEKK